MKKALIKGRASKGKQASAKAQRKREHKFANAQKAHGPTHLKPGHKTADGHHVQHKPVVRHGHRW
jgi:hypothetical protein